MRYEIFLNSLRYKIQSVPNDRFGKNSRYFDCVVIFLSQKDSVLSENSKFRKIKAKPATDSDRPSCRCGNATPKPGKLTCCGQRCACYMQSKACTGCRCRGCRNPHMIDGVKVSGKIFII